MGAKEINYIVRDLHWLKRKAGRVAHGNPCTDTEELYSSVIGRMAMVGEADRFEDTRQFRAYATRVLHNTAIDHARKHQSRDRVQGVYAQRDAQRQPVAKGPSLSDEIRVMLERMAVMDARQQDVVSLAARGLNSQEIGEQCSLPPSTIRSRLKAARLKLKGEKPPNKQTDKQIDIQAHAEQTETDLLRGHDD